MDNEEIINSEYFNYADLMGINTDGGDLLGKIARLPKEQQAGAIKNLLKKPPITVQDNNSRIEFEQKFSQLPKDIKEGLLKKRLQLVDTVIYTIKDVSGKSSIDMFQGTDNKNVALGNIANQKLEKDNWFILSALRLTYGVNPAGKEKVDFAALPVEIINGEFELEAGQKKLFGLTNNEIFDTRNRTDIPIGYYKIKSTKMIEPQVEIKMPIKFSAAVPADSFLKVSFFGTSVAPF